VDHLKSLVKSMPNQKHLVVEASGGPIKYWFFYFIIIIPHLIFYF
jgi:hypothetical protein